MTSAPAGTTPSRTDGRLQTKRIEPGYPATILSAVYSISPSTIACAISNLSNGSLCNDGNLMVAVA